MRQLFVDQDIHVEQRDRVEIRGRDHHHLARVLRAVAGEKVLLVDSAGHRFEATVEVVERDATLLSMRKPLPAQEPQPRLRLCLAPPKGKAWDQAIDAAAQLGAVEIWPVITRRVVVRWDQQKWPEKAERFERLLAEAAAQSNRNIPPALAAPMDLAQALAASKSALQLLAWEESKQASLGLLENAGLSTHGWINLWIGPEGGFEPAEAQALQKAGAVHFSLGQGLLRVPVAVAAGLSLVQAAWDRQMRMK